MAGKKKVKVRIGDVFAIKIEQDKYSYGQVIAEGRISDCMVIFDVVSKEHLPVIDITSKPIVFLIQTVNSRIEDGIWEVIGNAPLPHINFPVYKVETEDGYMLVDHSGDIINENPRDSEIEGVIELESWSPVSLEKVVTARFITGEWDSYYDDLIYLK
ncbi:Imm26 family immunity protein [Paenibacillus gorillae]|uniref:Imm26 family immunity protein n=1 Tax=Paenibacillus gorillae TaxID=1243662 RepID=UPI0005A98109|nr:Imm26 family immunity protein [Paenibacillus gorillae]